LTALVCVSAAPLGFLQQEKRDVDNTQAAVASADVVSELGSTDGEAPADYVAPEVAEDDESEDVEEKVADDSEEGVADEDDSEVPSGPTGGASLLQAEPADVTAGDAPADYAEPKVDDSEESDDSEEAAPKDEEDAAEAQADSFLQIDDVDNTKVADVDGNTNEHGDTDGEAPADYVAPVEAAEEDDSEDAEEKVDDDSEEGVADEESEEVSGPTGGAFSRRTLTTPSLTTMSRTLPMVARSLRMKRTSTPPMMTRRQAQARRTVRSHSFRLPARAATITAMLTTRRTRATIPPSSARC